MKVLVIGLGSIASKHIKALAALFPAAEFYALRSSKNAENKENITNIYAYGEIDFKPDFVIVSNPTSEHHDTLKKVAQLDCPVFIEKPSLASLEKSSEITQIFREKNTLTYVGFSLRFLSCLKFVKENLEKTARINEVNVYCGSYLPEWRPEVDFRNNYSAHASLGGGAHLDLIHELDYVCWFFGKPEKSERHLRSKSSLEIDSVDYANYYLEYKRFQVNIVLNYFRRDAKRTCEIVMEEDTWSIDLLKNTVTSYKNGILFSSDEKTDTYLEQMRYFTGCIQDHKQPMNTFEDSLEVLKICLDEYA